MRPSPTLYRFLGDAREGLTDSRVHPQICDVVRISIDLRPPQKHIVICSMDISIDLQGTHCG